MGLETAPHAAGWVLVLASVLGVAAGLAPGLGGVTSWVLYPSQAAGCVQPSGRGPMLGTAAGCGCRLGAQAAQGHCSGSLVKWGQRPRSTAGPGCWLGSLPGWQDVFHSFQVCPRAGGTGDYALQLSRPMNLKCGLSVAAPFNPSSAALLGLCGPWECFSFPLTLLRFS